MEVLCVPGATGDNTARWACVPSCVIIADILYTFLREVYTGSHRYQREFQASDAYSKTTHVATLTKVIILALQFRTNIWIVGLHLL